jgi:negative regulator of flagellin synthesis FlgM
MSIDIQGLPGGLVQNAGESVASARAPAEVGTSPQAQTAQVQSSDSVSLTDSATRLRQLESTIQSLPVVDAQRVEGVQRQLATGSFVLDPVSSADKLLEMERNLP